MAKRNRPGRLIELNLLDFASALIAERVEPFNRSYFGNRNLPELSVVNAFELSLPN
jgi:hypothetical protein